MEIFERVFLCDLAKLNNLEGRGLRPEVTERFTITAHSM